MRIAHRGAVPRETRRAGRDVGRPPDERDPPVAQLREVARERPHATLVVTGDGVDARIVDDPVEREDRMPRSSSASTPLPAVSAAERMTPPTRSSASSRR